MAFTYSKHGDREQPLRLNVWGGVNYSLPDDEIPDSDFTHAHNMYKDPISGRPRTRPGIIKYIDEPITLNYPVLSSSIFTNGTTVYPVFAANGVLKYASSGSYTAIDTLAVAALPPSMGMFEAGATPKLVVCDGGQVAHWGGSGGLTRISGTGAPATAKYFSETAGRIVVAGDGSQPQRIYIGSPGSVAADTFNTAGSGVTIDAPGEINGLAKWRGLLAVSIKGDRRICFYDLRSGTTTDWGESEKRINQTSPINNRSWVAVGSDLFYLDVTGKFMSVQATDQYGDIVNNPIGYKINSVLSPNSSYSAMWHNPYFNQIWVKDQNKEICWIYHYLTGDWTEVAFASSLIPYSAAYVESNGDLLIGMDNGYVYKHNPDVYGFTDDGSAYSWEFITKRFYFGSGMLKSIIGKKGFKTSYLRRNGGTIKVEALMGDNDTGVMLDSITVSNPPSIYQNINSIYLNNLSIYSVLPGNSISRNRAKGISSKFLLASYDGAAITMNYLETFVASPTGRA